MLFITQAGGQPRVQVAKEESYTWQYKSCAFTLQPCYQGNLKEDQNIVRVLSKKLSNKWVENAWFSYVGKIPDDRGFYFLPTIPDFAHISDNRQKSVPDYRETPCSFAIRGTGAQQFRGFEFSFVGNDCLGSCCRPQQKSGTRWENRKPSDSPDLSPSTPDDRGYLRFRVFISPKNLGHSGNSKMPSRLGFSRHMKARLSMRS